MGFEIPHANECLEEVTVIYYFGISTGALYKKIILLMQDFLLLVMKKNYDEFELQDESFYEMNMESPPTIVLHGGGMSTQPPGAE